MRWNTLSGAAPEIIAHRGASGERPEHTLAGYALALAQGADVIEPDLLPSADGVLFCRHDLSLARSTDIALHAAFAQLQVDEDWPIHRFSAAEISALRALQAFPGRSAAHDRQHPIPRFTQMIDWAAAAAAARGQPVVLYPEIKHPALLAAAGVDPVPLFVDLVTRLPPGVVLRVQCFDRDALRRIHQATGLPCVLLLERSADWSQVLREEGAWLAGIAVYKTLLNARGNDGKALIDAAHQRGLRVDAWTFRNDKPGADFESIDAELSVALNSGADGLFCDFPATVIALRARFSARVLD